jgi:tRNA(fMet)-specific endonuclease VapC
VARGGTAEGARHVSAQAGTGASVIILDTDHLTVLRYPESPLHAVLVQRMRDSVEDDFSTTIITAEEQMRGWMSLIARQREVSKQVFTYERLAGLFGFFGDWNILPFDLAAAARFDDLRRQKVRIGTPDLKIAAIVLGREALLLSANIQDFGRIPGLRVEN